MLAATHQATKTEEKAFRIVIIVNEPQFQVPSSSALKKNPTVTLTQRRVSVNGLFQGSTALHPNESMVCKRLFELLLSGGSYVWRTARHFVIHSFHSLKASTGFGKLRGSSRLCFGVTVGVSVDSASTHLTSALKNRFIFQQIPAKQT